MVLVSWNVASRVSITSFGPLVIVGTGGAVLSMANDIDVPGAGVWLGGDIASLART